MIEILTKHPEVLGSTFLICLLIIQQIIKQLITLKGRGDSNDSKLLQENIKLTRQTSETVNTCANRSIELIESVEEHMEKNDLGHLLTEFRRTVQVLEKMVDDKNMDRRALDGVAGLCRSIADDLQSAKSAVVHAEIQGQLKEMKQMIINLKPRGN